MNRLPSHAQHPSLTILLVEDDRAVRDFLRGALRSLGYRVIACSDGPSALADVARGTRADLLITDVMLPGGLHGREVAEALARAQPGLRVLFISGYPEHDLREKRILREDAILLKKPFRRAILARAVDEALYSPPMRLHGIVRT